MKRAETKSCKTTKTKILVYMVIAMILGYLPWYNFSAVSKYILDEFKLSTGDMGIILAVFQLGYVITVVFTGILADRIGKKRVISWATLLTGVFSTLFVWLAGDFTSILILRLLTGLSAGAIYAPGIALLADWFPPRKRGMAVGAYTGALTAAYAGGYFVAAPLAGYYGWRIGMLATSLPVFIAAYIVFFLVAEKPGSVKGLPAGEDLPAESLPTEDLPEGLPAESPPAAVLPEDLPAESLPRGLTAQPEVKPAPEGGYLGPFLITTGYMGHMWELYAFWGWIGPFMTACAYAVGCGQSSAVVLGGQLAAFIILSGAPAVWLVGIIADRWGRIKTTALCAFSSLLVQLFFGYLYGRSLILVVLTGFWIGFWVVADSGIYKAALSELVSVKIAATALGIQSAAGYFMTILSPYIFGRLLETFNSGVTDPTRTANWGIPFLILGLGALLAPLSMYLLKKTPQAGLLSGRMKGTGKH